MTFPYDDLLHLPHLVSARHPAMPRAARAAQFAPFAALVGYEDTLAETARITDVRITLDEDEKALLNDRLSRLAALLPQQPEATFTYFVPDTKKSGGAYATHTGQVKKIAAFEQQIVLCDQTVIPMEDIVSITSPVFSALETD